jgi:hypothetical protein
MWMKTSHDQSGQPASSTSTRFDGSSDRRAARAHPADPAPTITKSWELDPGRKRIRARSVEPSACGRARAGCLRLGPSAMAPSRSPQELAASSCLGVSFFGSMNGFWTTTADTIPSSRSTSSSVPSSECSVGTIA